MGVFFGAIRQAGWSRPNKYKLYYLWKNIWYCFGCREKTELQKSYAFSQKAGFVRMAEGMKQNVDKYYVPDYTKAYAFADSAIAHSPDNPHFYSMKAVWYMWMANIEKR